MESRSRLPRAASNPAIKPCSAASTTSRLPAPVRLNRQTSTLSRKPSIPLRLNRKITPSQTEPEKPASEVQTQKSLMISPAKRLLPSRSALGLTKPTISQFSRPATKSLLNPLGPKRTVSTTTSRTTSAASSTTNPKKTVEPSEYPNKVQRLNPNSDDIFKPQNTSKDESETSPTSGLPPTVKKHTPKKGILGLGSPSRSSRIPTTPSSRPSTFQNTQTPALPRLASVPWTPHHPDEQLKDMELSFTTEDDSNDNSFIESLDFGFATSRFASPRKRHIDQLVSSPNKSVYPKVQHNRSNLVNDEKLPNRGHQDLRLVWSEVTRAGEGDLEEVRIMTDLVNGLMADLEVQEKKMY